MLDHPPIDYPWETPPAQDSAIEVAPGILWLQLPLPMVLNHVNIYALDEGDSWIIVDTGMHAKRYIAVWETLLDGPLQRKPVRRVILTHHHPDHVGNAGWFAARGAEIWASRTAWLLARMLTLDVQEMPTPEILAYYRATGMADEIYAQRAAERPYNFADSVHPIPLGFRRLAEEQIIAAGGRRWTVRLGGGHAPDHVTLWSEDDNLVIAGDQILPSISPNLGVYTTEPEADPVSDWLESCERFREIARDDHLVLCGHNRPFTGLATRLTQLIDNHHGCL